MASRQSSLRRATVAAERESGLRALADTENLPAQSAGEVVAFSQLHFDKQFAAAMLANAGSVAAAYFAVAGEALPTAPELRALRAHAARRTVEQTLEDGYDNPETYKPRILAALVERALHAEADSVRLAAIQTLARMMPGWIAPSRSQSVTATVGLEDMLKAMNTHSHEPGDAAAIE
jgi:hypothetical protein